MIRSDWVTANSCQYSDGQYLEVVSTDLRHNHQVTELECKYHPKVRKVDQQTEKEMSVFLQ